MIIAEKTNKVQFSGNFETIKVGIDEKNVAHFFRMIANLYQDPVMAVLREIGANCVDALKEARTENLGWELHLPSRLDGNVRFIDNGVGISPEQMVRIYSVIGASSKRDNNDLIGGFGVGKWSICSLVNNFQAISRYNGTKSTYFIALQSNGLPDIKIVSQVPTSERNGFEVKFLCPEKHVSSFVNKASVAFRFFEIKPRVFNGGSQESITYIGEKPTFTSIDKTFEIYSKGGVDGTFVVMGGVGYRLPVENLLENKAFKNYESLLRSNLVVYAPIGEYSITPSREAIQLDDLTTTRLKAKLAHVVDSVIPELQKQIDAFHGNLWDAKLFLSKARNSFQFLPDTIQLDWKGTKLTCSDLKLKTKGVNVYYADRWNKKIKNTQDEKNLHVSNNSYIFLNDLKIGGIGRCKHFVATEKDKNSAYSIAVYVVDQKDLATFKAETGWIGDMNLTSALPPAPKTSAKAGGSKTSFFSMRSGRDYGVNDAVKPFDNKVVADEFILFPTFANKIGDHNAAVVDELIIALKKMTGKTFCALFLSKKQFDEFNEVEVDGKPIHKIADFLADKDIASKVQAFASSISVDDFKNAIKDWDIRYRTSEYMHFVAKAKGFKHRIFEIASLIPDAGKEVKSKTKDLIKMFAPSLLQDSSDALKKSVDEYSKGIKWIRENYPLFDFSVSKAESKQLIEYINLVDESNKSKGSKDAGN